MIVLCLVGSGYQVLQYQREQRWLAGKAQAIVQAVNAQSREGQIKTLQDYIRRHVRYEGLSIEGRPFLRATAEQVLVTGEGFCGEATRTFIALARPLGIRAQRVNLYGRANHVAAETELAPGRWVLVDVQINPATNSFLDAGWPQLDDVMADEASPFAYYTNVNLRRLPIVNLFVRRIKLDSGRVSWLLENPPLGVQGRLVEGAASARLCRARALLRAGGAAPPVEPVGQFHHAAPTQLRVRG